MFGKKKRMREEQKRQEQLELKRQVKSFAWYAAKDFLLNGGQGIKNDIKEYNDRLNDERFGIKYKELRESLNEKHKKS